MCHEGAGLVFRLAGTKPVISKEWKSKVQAKWVTTEKQNLWDRAVINTYWHHLIEHVSFYVCGVNSTHSQCGMKHI